MLKRFLTLLFLAALAVNVPAANLYVRSTDGSDADNGTTWALAKATLNGATSIASAGDTIWVSQSHAESTAGAVTITNPGTAASPIRILCGNDGAAPPTALATTGSVATTGANNLTINAGYAYIYGLTFSAGSAANAANLNFAAGNGRRRLEACTLKLNSTSTSSRIQFNQNGTSNVEILELINTQFNFGSTSQFAIPFQGEVLWTNTASAIQGTVPTTLFSPSTNNPVKVTLRGIDLSAAGSGKNLFSVANSGNLNVDLIDCKLGSSVSATTGTNAGTVLNLINCDSTSANTRFERYTYQGNITQETTVVRSSGSSDGTSSFSRKFVSSANSKFYSPLESLPITFWNETTGSSVTVTVETVTDNVTLTDAEAWIEVEYLGNSSFPIESIATSRAADVLASGSNISTSSVTWTTTGLTTPVKQKMSVTFTPQLKGPIRCRIYLAKASTTMYADQLTLTSSRRQYMAGAEGIVNEGAYPATPTYSRSRVVNP